MALEAIELALLIDLARRRSGRRALPEENEASRE